MLPSFLIPLCFWDSDPAGIDLRAHRRFIIREGAEGEFGQHFHT